MTPAFTAKLGLRPRPTNIGVQKIDDLPLETHDMALARFSLQNSQERVWFFKETFLLADTSMEVVLKMPFLSLSNTDIEFAKLGKLTWRSYTAAEALPTTSWVKLIDKREYAKVALDENSETFVIYVATIKLPTTMPIHPFRAPEILDYPTLAAFQYDKALTEIPAKYSDYAHVFSSDLAMELPENNGMNKHTIELIERKQPPYGPIYALSPVELEMLKTYIKIHLKTGFIWPFKSPAGDPILFDKKPDSSLRLCINYRGLKNLTIKNQYPMPLIGESLNRLGWAKRFTQLDLTNTYYRIRIWEGDE